MVRLVLLAVTLAAMGFACSGGSATPDTPPIEQSDSMPGPDTPVSSTDSMPAAPGGGAGTPCEAEIAMLCDEGFVDGCLKSNPDGSGQTLTTWHVCVEDLDWSAYGPPCEQQLAKECGDDAKDACLLTPAPASVHVCVKQ